MLQDHLAAPVPVDHRPLTRAPFPSRVLDVLLLLATAASAISATWGGSAADKGSGIGAATAFFLLTSLVWITLGLVFTAVRIGRIRKARKGDPRWPGWLAGRRTIYLITLGTAIIVLFNGANIIAYKGNDDVNSLLNRILGISMVLVAWTILQLAYTERYARMELENTGPQAHMDFPATPNPSLLEYAYFAFTIGSTFGTSDVTVQTSRMRGVVLCHGLLAFVYNTAVLGMVLSLISS